VEQAVADLTAEHTPRLAIVVKGFPRLSETFVARELAALEARGINFTLHALRHPGDDAKLVDNIVHAKPQYLPEYLREERWRVFRAYRKARRLPGFNAAWQAFRKDWPRDRGRARARRLGQACVLATELPESVTHIYAHFAHSPASVARYAAIIRGNTFSISAHAKDIWTAPDWDLSEKIADTEFVAVCNDAGAKRLKSLGDWNKIQLIHHGLPRSSLYTVLRAQFRDGTDPASPARLVCVARAVEKKGLRTLVAALALLPKNLAYELHHIGSGPLLDELKRRAKDAGVASHITWLGAQPHARVLQELDAADLFVLPANIARDNDRDGIPNAILEAQGRAVPVLACNVGGVGEAVKDKSTGRLTIAGDAQQFAKLLEELIKDPSQRAKLGNNGYANVSERFDAEKGYDRIATLLRRHMS
jgi:glycosyltransferase involved in cell wall biosynthesis